MGCIEYGVMKAHVITVSDRCHAGQREDLSGPLAVALLSGWSVEIAGHDVIPDGAQSVQDAIVKAVKSGVDLVFTTGGTGISPRDETPDGTLPLISKRLDGIESLIRQAATGAPAAPLSRAIAGIVNLDGHSALVINAPGSRGGVTDAIASIGPLLAHVVDQLAGGDHPAPHSAHSHSGKGTSRIAKADHTSAHARATYANQHSAEHPTNTADVVHAKVSDEVIDMNALASLVERDEAGAVVTFIGVVRNHDAGRSVTSIDYEAHPDAEAVVTRVAHDVAEKSGVLAIAVQHRVGHLEIGDLALGAAVSAAHRREAIDILDQLIEQVKLELPVWKKQAFPDGSHEWTGSA